MLVTKCGWSLLGRETKNDRIKIILLHEGYELRDWEGPWSQQHYHWARRGGGSPSRITLNRRSPLRLSWTLSLLKCYCKGHFCKGLFHATRWDQVLSYDEVEKEKTKLTESEKPDPMRNSSRKRKDKANIEIGSHLTLTTQTLRVIQARGQGTHQTTTGQQRRKQRRRSTRSGEWRVEGVVERRNQEFVAWSPGS